MLLDAQGREIVRVNGFGFAPGPLVFAPVKKPAPQLCDAVGHVIVSAPETPEEDE